MMEPRRCGVPADSDGGSLAVAAGESFHEELDCRSAGVPPPIGVDPGDLSRYGSPMNARSPSNGLLCGLGLLLCGALSSCGESTELPAWSAAESKALRFMCHYGIGIEPILPPVLPSSEARAEICLATRCGTATLRGGRANETFPLVGTLPGILRLDGRGTELEVNVGENEGLRDGDIWQVTIFPDGTTRLGASRSVTYDPVYSYADPPGSEPRVEQCSGVTSRRGYFKFD